MQFIETEDGHYVNLALVEIIDLSWHAGCATLLNPFLREIGTITLEQFEQIKKSAIKIKE